MEKRLRLRSLVNKELSFYPKKSCEREVINKYDSDEENQIEYDSENEVNKDVVEKSNGRQVDEGKIEKVAKQFKEDEELKEKTLEELKSQARSEKSAIVPRVSFEFREDDYVDQELVEVMAKVSIQEEFETFKDLFSRKLSSEKMTLQSANFYSRMLCQYIKFSDIYADLQGGMLSKLLLNLHTFMYEEKNKSSVEFTSFYNSLLTASDLLMNYFLKTSLSILEIIPVVISLLKLLILNEENESCYKSLIMNLNKIKESAYISKDQSKDLMTICISLLKKKCLSNIFLQLIDIVCYIVKNNNDYYVKLIEMMVSWFNCFTEEYCSSEEKISQIDKRIIRGYYNHFGIYSCYNSQVISIYSLLFMRAFGILYYTDSTGDENTDRNEYSFNKIFELYITKILDSKRDSILYALYCLTNDFLIVRYNLEFQICLVLLTNVFVYLSQLISQEEIELSRRKFFMNCYSLILDEILIDFGNMKRYYLCHSSNQACQLESCFSCKYSHEIAQNRNFYYNCSKCTINTNLKLQIITESREKDTSVCSFCDIQTLFNEYPTLLNNDNEITISTYDYKESTSLFDNFLKFQDNLYRNCFLFLRVNILNYFKEINKNEIYADSLSQSFTIFLKIFLSDSKVNFNEYYFTQIKQFFDVQKYKLINLIPDIHIDDSAITYFYFYYFYINFLFVGNIRLTEVLIDDSINWNIRNKSLKMLEKFMLFEGKESLFKHFNIDLVSSLLSDGSFHIREHSLEVLLKFYRYGKIERNDLLCILYENINETSFLIRKRIIKALIDLIYTDEINNIDIMRSDDAIKSQVDHFKNVNFIFLSKLVDNSESDKIKSLIIEYYYSNFNNTKKHNFLSTNTLVIFIKLLSENEDYNLGSLYLDNISLLFTKVK
jgi:hypothetical protein